VVVAVVVVADGGRWGHRVVVNDGGGVVAVASSSLMVVVVATSLSTAIVSETQKKANKRLTDIIKFVRWWPSSSLSNAEARGGVLSPSSSSGDTVAGGRVGDVVIVATGGCRQWCIGRSVVVTFVVLLQ